MCCLVCACQGCWSRIDITPAMRGTSTAKRLERAPVPTHKIITYFPHSHGEALEPTAKVGLGKDGCCVDELFELGTKTSVMRTAPLVRVKAKFTVKNAVCERLRQQHTAVLTVISAFILKSGFAPRAFTIRASGQCPNTIFCPTGPGFSDFGPNP